MKPEPQVKWPVFLVVVRIFKQREGHTTAKAAFQLSGSELRIHHRTGIHRGHGSGHTDLAGPGIHLDLDVSW